jgi:hypothetical protein
MLPQTAASYSGSYKISQIHTLSWDYHFNSRNSKQFNLECKTLECMNRAYNTYIGLVLLFLQWAILQQTAYKLVHAQLLYADAKTARQCQLIYSVPRQDGV